MVARSVVQSRSLTVVRTSLNSFNVVSVVEERLALRPPPAEEDVVGDEPPVTEGVFKVSQLQNLQSQLQQASREELPVETALEIVLRVCSSRGGAPPAWEAASAASIDAVVKQFDHQCILLDKRNAC